MVDHLSVIVQSAQRGDADALATLVQLYQTPARRVAQTILSNRDDAEEPA